MSLDPATAPGLLVLGGHLAQILRRFNAALERIEDERKIAKIIIEVGEAPDPTTVAKATLPGDRDRLRGIPVEGFGGAIPGSKPHTAVHAPAWMRNRWAMTTAGN